MYFITFFTNDIFYDILSQKVFYLLINTKISHAHILVKLALEIFFEISNQL
jgi:hypothetical protein